MRDIEPWECLPRTGEENEATRNVDPHDEEEIIVPLAILGIINGTIRELAYRIGAYWVALTIIFEFGFGHHVDGKSWTDLLNNYNLVDGQAWILVLVWMAVAPAVVSRTTVESRRYF